MKTTTIAAALTALLTAVEGTVAFPSTGTTALREEAAKKDLIFGCSAINQTYLEDPEFAAVLPYQFNGLGPENQLKWVFIHPTEGQYNWDPIDIIVEFAENNNMLVKGNGHSISCCDDGSFRSDHATLQGQDGSMGRCH